MATRNDLLPLEWTQELEKLQGHAAPVPWETMKPELEHGLRCVRIVHGTGYGSRNGEPVLRHAVRRWLTQLPQAVAKQESMSFMGDRC
ncbi:hypothetical protein QWA_17250 [Alcaligenes faecalis subsp. faecalis NCIB 8687]|nr:hypothetical protein QWA_17250 [Alcaligenes faecalis subsp. faecalis NCIB 8687]